MRNLCRSSRAQNTFLSVHGQGKQILILCQKRHSNLTRITRIVSLQSLKKEKAKASAIASEDTTHILGIITSLFTNLASESPARIRLLAKFVEGTYEKVDRLLEIREHAEGRLKVVDHEIEQERKVLRDACSVSFGVN